MASGTNKDEDIQQKTSAQNMMTIIYNKEKYIQQYIWIISPSDFLSKPIYIYIQGEMKIFHKYKFQRFSFDKLELSDAKLIRGFVWSWFWIANDFRQISSKTQLTGWFIKITKVEFFRIVLKISIFDTFSRIWIKNSCFVSFKRPIGEKRKFVISFIWN